MLIISNCVGRVGRFKPDLFKLANLSQVKWQKLVKIKKWSELMIKGHKMIFYSDFNDRDFFVL